MLVLAFDDFWSICSRLALDNLKNLRVDIYHEGELLSLEAVTNHVITDKHALVQTIQQPTAEPLVKEGACEQLAEWLEMAAKDALELDVTYLKKIKTICGKQLRIDANSSKTKARSGDALKIALKLTAPDLASLRRLLARGSTGRERAAEGDDTSLRDAEARADEDRGLFKDLLLQLIRGNEKAVKVKGTIMCILGLLYSQYASIIGTWQVRSAILHPSLKSSPKMGPVPVARDWPPCPVPGVWHMPEKRLSRSCLF